MQLERLLNKKSMTVLGLNSGTSADGLDVAAVRISRGRGGIRIKCLATRARKMPPQLREAVLATAESRQMSLDDLVRLDSALGAFFGRTAASSIKRFRSDGIKVDAVASHGQTVRHLPTRTKTTLGRFHGTLQLGSLDRIAVATGLVTVGDFRQADVAIGGEGAPITIAAMERMFASRQQSRLIVNIGGMANFFSFPVTKTGPATGADCGPGNVLSDALTSQLFGDSYDRGGRRAQSGEISDALLERLRTEKFFASRAKSTGREQFGSDLVERIIKLGRKYHLSPEDLIATAMELTAVGVVRSIRKLSRRLALSPPQKLYLTGGGRHNTFLQNRLSHHLPEITVASVDELGIDGDFVEAVAFAVMGEAALRGEALSIGHRGRKAVLGRITQPPETVATGM
jgi:anhydro-N-acetylmuramic acid kinase